MSTPEELFEQYSIASRAKRLANMVDLQNRPAPQRQIVRSPSQQHPDFAAESRAANQNAIKRGMGTWLPDIPGFAADLAVDLPYNLAQRAAGLRGENIKPLDFGGDVRRAVGTVLGTNPTPQLNQEASSPPSWEQDHLTTAIQLANPLALGAAGNPLFMAKVAKAAAPVAAEMAGAHLTRFGLMPEILPARLPLVRLNTGQLLPARGSTPVLTRGALNAMYRNLRKAEQEAMRLPDEDGIRNNPNTEVGRLLINNKPGRRTAYGGAGEGALPDLTEEEFSVDWGKTPAHADMFHTHPRKTFPAVSTGDYADIGAWKGMVEQRRYDAADPGSDLAKFSEPNMDLGTGVIQFPYPRTARSTIWRSVVPPLDEFGDMVEAKDLSRAGRADLKHAFNFVRENFPEHSEANLDNFTSALGAQRAANQGLVDYFTDLNPNVDNIIKFLANRYPQKKAGGGSVNPVKWIKLLSQWLEPSIVAKPPGGNWVPGTLEKFTSNITTPEGPVTEWKEGALTNYLKSRFGTEKDEIRNALALTPDLRHWGQIRNHPDVNTSWWDQATRNSISPLSQVMKRENAHRTTNYMLRAPDDETRIGQLTHRYAKNLFDRFGRPSDDPELQHLLTKRPQQLTPEEARAVFDSQRGRALPAVPFNASRSGVVLKNQRSALRHFYDRIEDGTPPEVPYTGTLFKNAMTTYLDPFHGSQIFSEAAKRADLAAQPGNEWLSKVPLEQPLWTLNSNRGYYDPDFQHMADYVNAATEAGEINPDLIRQGRLSMDRVFRETVANDAAIKANKANLEQRQAAQALLDNPKGISTISERPDGYRWDAITSDTKRAAKEATVANSTWCFKSPQVGCTYINPDLNIHVELLRNPSGVAEVAIQIKTDKKGNRRILQIRDRTQQGFITDPQTRQRVLDYLNTQASPGVGDALFYPGYVDEAHRIGARFDGDSGAWEFVRP